MGRFTIRAWPPSGTMPNLPGLGDGRSVEVTKLEGNKVKTGGNEEEWEVLLFSK